MRKKFIFRFALIVCSLYMILGLTACDIYTKADVDNAINNATLDLNDEKTTLLGRIDELEKENAALKNCIEGIHTGDESVCTVCGSSKQPVPDNKAQSKFEKKQYTDNGATINYWLYTPENATENMPLIVYLHGGSGKGDDLELITSVDGFPQYLRDGKIAPNAYVLIPQVSSSFRGWGEIKTEIMKLITFVTNECKTDENRISLTGHSMGGTGVWMFALAYPNAFSAVAPLSGSVTLTDANVQKLKNVPVWAMVGTDDTIVDPQSSINFIAELSKVNDKAKLTELDGADHFEVPNTSYLSSEFDLIGWLVQQSK